MEIAIEAIGLHKKYGSLHALKNIELKIEKGEVFGFLGQNGAGKTTFLKVLLGLCKPSSGEVLIFNEKIHVKTKSKIGYLPEKVSIPGFLEAGEFLRYCGRLSGIPNSFLESRVNETLEKVGLKEQKKQKVQGFSKGMTQRLGLAQAMIHKPEILLLDEPGSGLDPKGMIDLRNIILEENKSENVTVFLNSHRLLEAEKICSRVAVLQKGNLIASGKLSELTKSKNQIRMELEEISSELREFFDKISINHSYPTNHTVVFQPSETTDVRLIPKLVVEKGGNILKYEKASENLEEIFLRLIDTEKTNES